MLQGKELHKSIQKRCRIQPGMLVKSSHADVIDKLALVVKVQWSGDYGTFSHPITSLEVLNERG